MHIFCCCTLGTTQFSPCRWSRWWWEIVANNFFSFLVAHLSKVKSAMAGFQLPVANIPDWAQQIPEDQWKQRLVDKLSSPAKTERPTSRGKSKHSSAATDSNSRQAPAKRTDKDSEWPGATGT